MILSGTGSDGVQGAESIRAAALSVLTRDGSTDSAAIRRALVAEAQRSPRDELPCQAKALTADDHDREQARQVLAGMCSACVRGDVYELSARRRTSRHKTFEINPR